MGLRDSTRISPAAFIANCNASSPLVSCLLFGVQESASTFCSPLHRKDLFFKGERAADNQLRRLLPAIQNDIRMSTQRQLQSLLDSAMWHSIRDNASPRDRARLNMISAQHAGAWLRAVTNPNMVLTMPQKEFTISLRLWLGIPLFPSDLGSKRCFCGQFLDQFGDHLLGCGPNNLRIRRHDTLSDVLFHALLVDNANCRKEQRCSSDNSRRPGDVFHPDFDQGRPTYFDITVRNSLVDSLKRRQARQQNTRTSRKKPYVRPQSWLQQRMDDKKTLAFHKYRRRRVRTQNWHVLQIVSRLQRSDS